jgi:hypothetical protein
MKTFAEFLASKGLNEALIDRSALVGRQVGEGDLGLPELQKAISKSLNMKRNQMSQVPTDCLNLFRSVLDSQGMRHVTKQLPPVQILPAQSDINLMKAKRMKENLGELPKKPLIAIHDGTNIRLVDGHHKWAALFLLAYELADMGRIANPGAYTTDAMVIMSPKGIGPVLKVMDQVVAMGERGQCHGVVGYTMPKGV